MLKESWRCGEADSYQQQHDDLASAPAAAADSNTWQMQYHDYREDDGEQAEDQWQQQDSTEAEESGWQPGRDDVWTSSAAAADDWATTTDNYDNAWSSDYNAAFAADNYNNHSNEDH